MVAAGHRDEIVDDSEPEREEWRRQRKKSHPKAMLDKPVMREVIELTDESEGESIKSANVIDISDFACDSSPRETLSSPVKQKGTLVLKKQSPSVSPEAERGQPLPMASTLVPPSTISTQSDIMTHGSLPPIDGEDMDDKVDFRRFALINSRASTSDSSRPGPSRKRSRAGTEPSINPPKRKAATHRFSAEFSDAQLAKLTKCVSCNVPWTTRKAAAQKIKHVQSCAKKHSFNDETICFLIRKEIECLTDDVGKPTNKKATGKALTLPEQSAITKTVYEHVLTDAAPRKKGRRAEAGETIKSINATRIAILDRARAVLDPIPSEYPTEVGIGSPGHIRSIGPSYLGNRDCPMPSTQSFGQSALAQKYRTDTHHSTSFPSSSSEEEDSALPATQAFGSSRFGGAIRPHEPLHSRTDLHPSFQTAQAQSLTGVIWAKTLNEPLLSSNNLSCDINSAGEHSPSPVLRKIELTNGQLSNRTARVDGLTRTFEKQCNINDISDLEDPYEPFSEREMDNENAYLHFDPGPDNQQQLVGPSDPSDTSAPSQAMSLPHSLGNATCVHPAGLHAEPSQPKTTCMADIGVENSLKTKESNAKRKAKGKRLLEPEDDLDGLWEARMKDLVLRDTNLHHRILRYEPIPFSVFLKLATDGLSCSPSGKLKTRLRSYLDKEAISFYGTEPKGWRR